MIHAPAGGEPQWLLFLPGASGNIHFWRPVAERLHHESEKVHLGWPGFGDTPSDPRLRGFEDLLTLVLAQLDRPCALIAQSMGGVLALQAALGAQNWQAGFLATHPQLPDWFAADTTDLTSPLPQLTLPVLLLWGETDPISPVAVGERLAALLPRSRLKLIPSADHDLGLLQADQVAPLIDAHLIDAHLTGAPVLAPP
jgi:pimeloyl-ACP methyl ester carboxylesterase